jgi:PAS domain S-box-containing protein
MEPDLDVTSTRPRAEDVLALLPEGVLVVSEVGTILMANAAACEMFGHPDLAGLSLQDLVPGALGEAPVDPRRAPRAAPRPRSRTGKVLQGRHADGSPLSVEVKVSASAGGGGTIVIVSDVRERLSQEPGARAGDRMLSAEALIDMVLHEISRPLLTATARFADLIDDLDPDDLDDDGLFDRLSEASFALEHLEDVIRDLGALSRRDETRSWPLLDLVKRGWRLASPLQLSAVDLSISPKLRVHGPPTLLVQVFVNLFRNAIEAVDVVKRGTLSVRAEAGEDEVTLDFSDRGGGIEPDARLRIFEPYFSTKPRDRVSGLGLPVCRTIVEAAGGRLQLVDSPGWATTFRVVLRRAEEAD